MNFLKSDITGKRIYGLDILRALAILFVVIGHSSLYLNNRFHSIPDLIVLDGVTIFFVLSGYLIGSILIKLLENNNATIKTLFNFWVKRWLRTLPNYYMVLFLLLVLLPYFFYGSVSNPFKHLKYIFFIQNFNSAPPHFFEEAWSLSVEEWFYIIVPVSIFLLIGFKVSVKNAILHIAIGLILFTTVFRYYKFLNISVNTMDDWDKNFRKEVMTRLDSNMFGVLGAFMSYYYSELWKKYKCVLFCTGVVLLLIGKYVYFGLGVYQCVFSFSTMSIGVLLLLPLLSEYKQGSGVIFKSFTFISIISYSMYLLNYSLFREYASTHYLSGIWGYSWYWVFNIAGAFLLNRLIEKPIMDFRDRL